MKGIPAVCLAIFIAASALTMPAGSLAFMHDDIATSLNPEEPGQEPKLPLARETGQRDYRVELKWDPVEIKPNKMVSFDLRIVDLHTNRPAENVYYNFMVVKDSEAIKELEGSFALRGEATHTVEFPSSGSFRVLVNVLGSDALAKNGEAVSFDLRVVPEFPMGTIIVAATLVGITIVLTRFTVLSKRTVGSDTPLQ